MVVALFTNLNFKKMKPLPTAEAEVNYSRYKGLYFTTMASSEIHSCEQIILYEDGSIDVKTDMGNTFPFIACRWIKQII